MCTPARVAVGTRAGEPCPAEVLQSQTDRPVSREGFRVRENRPFSRSRSSIFYSAGEFSSPARF